MLLGPQAPASPAPLEFPGGRVKGQLLETHPVSGAQGILRGGDHRPGKAQLSPSSRWGPVGGLAGPELTVSLPFRLLPKFLRSPAEARESLS